MTIKFNETHETTMRGYSIYQLADLANCGTPDSPTSPGAGYLDTVRRDVLDYFLEDSWGAYPEDMFSQIAESAMPVYTHDTAQTFTDLCAYAEDITELANGDASMTQRMGLAIYVIGERLANALFNAYKHTLEDLEN